ncbi:DUF1820 family protein [Lysobacter arvi]|uniref:DUF1820 family protein n=1 Tax=Lysobacter arvi TaxID=3038776 RepID=A0ABU1CGI4_9GAMM|nr:DUF1820 family protein [Lysobacter arvi]MDR0184059.1 DUF1820 family protein [Lysobacter arvi]
MSKPLYKVTFLNAGKVYELYARNVTSGALWGFTEVSELVFDVHDGVVIDPTEERLRDEFGNTRALHLPMHSIVRIEEVERKGQSAIRDATTGEKVVTPFPLPGKPR